MVEEEVALGIGAGNKGASDVGEGHPNDLGNACPAASAGAGEHQLFDQFGALFYNLLGDEAAQGEGEELDTGEPHSIDEVEGLVCHALDGGGNLAGGSAYALVVKGNDAVVGTNLVD